MIDRDREKYYIDKWSTLPLLVVSKPTKLEKFEYSLGGSQLLLTNQDYDNWGLVLASSKELDNLLIIKDSNNLFYKITTNKDLISTIEVLKGQNTLLTFTESHFKDNIFERKFDKFTYYIKNGKIILKVKELKTEFLQPKKAINLLSEPRVITFDLETITNKLGIMKAYLYSM